MLIDFNLTNAPFDRVIGERETARASQCKTYTELYDFLVKECKLPPVRFLEMQLYSTQMKHLDDTIEKIASKAKLNERDRVALMKVFQEITEFSIASVVQGMMQIQKAESKQG